MLGKRLVDQDLLVLQLGRMRQFTENIGIFDEALLLAEFADKPIREFEQGDKKVAVLKRQGVELKMTVKTIQGCDAYIEIEISFDGAERGAYQIVYKSSVEKAIWIASSVQNWPESGNAALEEFKEIVGELRAEESGGIKDAEVLSIFVDMINTYKAAPALSGSGS